jgi:hypothetical protein
MRSLLLLALFVTPTVYAQGLSFNEFKSLLTAKKETLEKVYQGQSKKLVSFSDFDTDLGTCKFTETIVQTVLKIEDDNVILHSKESFIPAQSKACEGQEAQEVAYITFEEKPTVATEVKEFEAIEKEINSISKEKDIVTLVLSADGQKATYKYDLSKSFFNYLLVAEDSLTKITGEDIADVDVYSIDLTKVLFCEADYCTEGDWSDILF